MHIYDVVACWLTYLLYRHRLGYTGVCCLLTCLLTCCIYAGPDYTVVYCGLVEMGASKQENRHDRLCVLRYYYYSQLITFVITAADYALQQELL